MPSTPTSVTQAPPGLRQKALPLLYAEPWHLHDRAPALDRKQGSQYGLTTHNLEVKQEIKVWHCLAFYTYLCYTQALLQLKQKKLTLSISTTLRLQLKLERQVRQVHRTIARRRWKTPADST